MSDNDTHQLIPWLRQGAAYAASHQGKTVVVCLPVHGSLARLRRVIRDVALLKVLGIKPVLVFSCRALIDKATPDQTPFHDGMRVTDSNTLKTVIDVTNRTRVQIEALLAEGLPDTPPPRRGLTATSGNFITARPLGIHHGVNFEHTGVVRRIDAASIRALLDLGHLVILPPIGYSPTGELFNLEAKQVAQAAAIALKADKLILLTESFSSLAPHIGREITCGDALQLSDKLPDDIRRDLRTCTNAVSGGTPRAHLIDAESDGALLQELFTRDGHGCMISGDPFETLRAAELEDLAGILDLIAPMEESGALVPRPHEVIELEIEHYQVIERDGKIIACAALFPLADSGIGELSCFAVHPAYRLSQRGKQLLGHMEKRAEGLGLSQLCVLTTQTAHWFVEHGFQQANLDALPDQKKSMYNFQRNSQVFLKQLDA